MISPLFRASLLAVTLLAPVSARAADPEPSFAGRPLAAWVRDLDDPNVLVREEALEVLAKAGPAAKEALTAVKPLLKDDRPTVRLRAAVALWKIEGRPEDAGPVLLKALRQPGRDTRLLAIEALGQLGGEVKGAPAALVACLADPDTRVSFQAQSALLRMGPAGVSGAAAALEDKDPAVVRAALRVLNLFGRRAADAAPAVRARLKDGDPHIRLRAAETLWQIRGEAEPSFPVVLELARSPDPAVRQQALAVLLPLKPKPKEAVPVLLEAIKDASPLNRVRAAEALWETDKRTKETIPVLVQAVADPSQFSAYGAASAALRGMGPAAGEVVPALMEALKASPPNSLGQGRLITVINQLGPDAAEPLGKYLTDNDARVRAVVITALGHGGAKAVAPLLKALPKVDFGERLLIYRTFGGLRHHAAPAVPALIDAVKSPDAQESRAALLALQMIGPPARAAAPAVLAVLKDANRPPQDRRVALGFFERVGPGGKAAVPTLIDLVKDKKQPVFHQQAIHVLGQIGPAAREAVPTLREVLKTGAVFDRYRAAEALAWIDVEGDSAARALGEMLQAEDVRKSTLVPTIIYAIPSGPAGKEAVPALVEGLKSPGASARQNYILALRRIGPAAKEAAPALKELLASPDRLTRTEAAVTLAALGAADAGAVKVLAQAAADAAVPNRINALDALLALGPAAKEAAPALLRAWEAEGQVYLRLRLAQVIATIDPAAARPLAPWLRERLRDPATPDPGTAGAALVKIAPDDAEPITVLRGLLWEGGPKRSTIALALGRLGPAAKAAVPELEAMLKDPEPMYSGHAALALWRIDPAKAEQAVSVLAEVLKDPDGLRAGFQANLLKEITESGPDPARLVPALLDAYRTGEAVVRQAVVILLRQHDPKALAKLAEAEAKRE